MGARHRRPAGIRGGASIWTKRVRSTGIRTGPAVTRAWPGGCGRTSAHSPAFWRQATDANIRKKAIRPKSAIAMATGTIIILCGPLGCSGKWRAENQIAASCAQLLRQFNDPRRGFRAHLDHIDNIGRIVTASDVRDQSVGPLFQLGNNLGQIIRLRLARLQCFPEPGAIVGARRQGFQPDIQNRTQQALSAVGIRIVEFQSIDR